MKKTGDDSKMRWRIPTMTSYIKGQNPETDKEFCITLDEFNGFFDTPRKHAIDKKEWEYIGKFMGWK